MNIKIMNEEFKKMSEFLSGNIIRIDELYNKNSKEQKTNIIWSSKDVISSSLKVIETLKFEEGSLVEREKDLYSLIVSIDKILEAMEQINRVVFDTKDQIEFKSSIFVNKDNKCDLVRFSVDDREYFKNIRAIFTAHSSNLKLRKCNKDECKEVNCKGSKCKKNEFKFASSWILDNRITHPGEYGCLVYSLDGDMEDLKVGVSISDLMDFLHEIFKNTNSIINEIIATSSIHIFSEINKYRNMDEFKKWNLQDKNYFSEMRKTFKLFTLKKRFEEEEVLYYKDCVACYYYLLEAIENEYECERDEIEDTFYIQCPSDIKSSFERIRELPKDLSDFNDEKFNDSVDDLEYCIKYLTKNNVNIQALKKKSSFMEKLLLVKSCMYVFSNYEEYDEGDWEMPKIVLYPASAVDVETGKVIKGKEHLGRNLFNTER